MAIGTDDAVLKIGTQTEVTSGTPAAISSGAFGLADQGGTVAWANADDVELAAAVLKCQFATMPTVGSIGLYARLLDVQSTNDLAAPASNFPAIFCGSFPINFGAGNATNFWTVIHEFAIPIITTAQKIDWYLKNEATAQTISASWQLWITPKAFGPKT